MSKGHLYVLIRIPKSGSQTLREMVRSALPESTYFRLPRLDIDGNVDSGLSEVLRRKRRILKGVLAHGALTEKGMWRKIAFRASCDDIVSGHIAYGRADLPDWKLRCVTLLRDPIERMFSEYSYAREGYRKRASVRRSYQKGRPEAAGTGGFGDYLEYLCERSDLYANPATAYITGSRTHPHPFEFLKQHYFHFGVLESLDTFAAGLSEKIGANVSEVWKNRTRARTEQTLTARDRERLAILLDRDIQLYEQAREAVASGS